MAATRNKDQRQLFMTVWDDRLSNVAARLVDKIKPGNFTAPSKCLVTYAWAWVFSNGPATMSGPFDKLHASVSDHDAWEHLAAAVFHENRLAQWDRLQPRLDRLRNKVHCDTLSRQMGDKRIRSSRLTASRAGVPDNLIQQRYRTEACTPGGQIGQRCQNRLQNENEKRRRQLQIEAAPFPQSGGNTTPQGDRSAPETPYDGPGNDQRD